MRFMVQVRADRGSEAGKMPSKELVAAMGRFNEEMIGAGIMQAGEGLHPSSQGARIVFGGGEPRVVEPPFAAPDELIAGFWILQVGSKEEAIAWAKRAPFGDGAILEIRQIFEAADFPEDILPAADAAREHAWRDEQQRKTAPTPPQQSDRSPHHTEEEHPMQLQPYLSFEGRCEEAIAFYRETVGAEVKMMLRWKDSPDPSMCGPGNENKIMHAHLRIGETALLASDGRCQGQPDFQGFSLSLTVANEAEADRAFAALSRGGQVQMPLAHTFFSPRFGMVADRFGVSWMVYVEPKT